MSRRWVATLGVVAALWATGKHANAQCSMDTECKGARLCEAGRCVEPPPAPQPAAPPAPQPAAPASAAQPPPAAAPVAESPPLTQRRSTALMVFGIVATGVGGGLVLIGLTLPAMGAMGCPESGCSDSDDFLGIALLGGVLVAGGIPMLLYGAKRVPAGPRLALAPWASPTAAGLKLRLEL